jgi:sugar phosphate permease
MRYRWVVWGILVLAYLIGYFHRLSIGVVREDLVREFSISSTIFANLGATYFYAYIIMQIPSGILADLLGARITVSAGILTAGIGSIIFGLAPGIAWAFVGRLLVGLGVSVIFISILKVQSQWFEESEFGTMSGITTFVGNMGAVLAQTPLALFVAVISWQNCFVVIGFFSILVSVLCFILVRNTPEDMSSQPITGIERKKNDPAGQKLKILKGIKTVMANPATWPSFVLFFTYWGAFISLTGVWGSSYLVDVYKVSKVTAANYMVAPVVGLAFGSIVIGNFSDRIRKRKIPMVLFATINVICWGIILLSGIKLPAQILIPLFFILGLSNTSFILGWACSKEVNPPEISGIAMSVTNIGGSLGAAILPLLLGRVFDKFEGLMPIHQIYHHAFMYCLISVIIGLLVTLLIKETNCRNIYLPLRNSSSNH